MAATVGGAPGFPWRGTSTGGPGPAWRGAARPRSRRLVRCRAGGPVQPLTVRWRPAVAAAARPARRRGVRLTRRGRVVVLLLLVALAGLLVVGVASVSRAADRPGPPPTAVVQPGDTLWSVAERHVPGGDPFGAIEQIRRLNDLPDYTVHPGQELVLPDAG